jgi:tripartite-type tricarboxylate transporter receptor subunit TctC
MQGVSQKVVATAAGVLFMLARAWAQEAFPSRPVTVIVPFQAGQGVDITARALSA